MGFFDNLKSLGSSLLNDANNALSRISDKPTMIRVCQAAFLIANADDNFDDSEKQMLQKVVSKKLPQFKNAEIAKAVEDAVDECAFSAVAGKINLMENIQEARGNHEQAKLIMLAVLAVANADGEFSPVEQTMAREICTKLGLSTREYGL